MANSDGADCKLVTETDEQCAQNGDCTALLWEGDVRKKKAFTSIIGANLCTFDVHNCIQG